MQNTGKTKKPVKQTLLISEIRFKSDFRSGVGDMLLTYRRHLRCGWVLEIRKCFCYNVTNLGSISTMIVSIEFYVSFVAMALCSPDISPILQKHVKYWYYTKEFY